MNIISWNCNMAFRNKYQQISWYSPDLLIIQEAESNEVMLKKHFMMSYNQYIWIGNNIHKGLAIISTNDTTIKTHHLYNPEYKFIIPVEVKNRDKHFILLAVWTQYISKQDSYISQIYKAVDFYKDILDQKHMLVIGDFNSNSQWDMLKPSRKETHSGLVQMLSDLNIYSMYHKIDSITHGYETTPTLYFRKQKDIQYHIDYVFIPSSYFSSISSIKIGDYESYIKYSDHMPLFIKI